MNVLEEMSGCFICTKNANKKGVWSRLPARHLRGVAAARRRLPGSLLAAGVFLEAPARLLGALRCRVVVHLLLVVHLHALRLLVLGEVFRRWVVLRSLVVLLLRLLDVPLRAINLLRLLLVVGSVRLCIVLLRLVVCVCVVWLGEPVVSDLIFSLWLLVLIVGALRCFNPRKFLLCVDAVFSVTLWLCFVFRFLFLNQ